MSVTNIGITELLLVVLVTFLASYIQSVTGFGFGIFAMIFFPYLLSFKEANILSTMLSVFVSVALLVVMRKKVNWKNTVFPMLGCLASTIASVLFIRSQDGGFLKLLLGIALVLLSVYFFFFSGKIKIRPTWYAGLIAGLLSGIMGGMFSMSGPPVVVYFLQSEEDSDGYLATLSAYFVLSGAMTIAIKAASGFATVNVLAAFLVGFAGMLAGTFVGKLTRSRMKPQMIKKAVYAVMACSGALNVIMYFI